MTSTRRDTLTISAKTDGLKGTVVITGGGTGLTYQPGTDATGADSFTYTASDGHGGDVVGTVSVIIAEGSLPVASTDSATMLEDAAATLIPVLGQRHGRRRDRRADDHRQDQWREGRRSRHQPPRH